MDKKRRIWLTVEQQLSVVSRYTAGETPDKIADSLGICANNVRNTLRKHGIVARDRSEACTRLPHWKEAFDKITPESAYWLGFLFADGCVTQHPVGSAALYVGLADRDRGHLEKLRAYLKSTHVIISKDTKPLRGKIHRSCNYALRSAYLCDALMRHGMKNKSLSRVAPDYLAGSRDFWRGMIDGDGFASTSEDKKARLGLYGGEVLMQQFLDYLRHMGIAKNTEVHRHTSSGIDDSDFKPGKIFRMELVSGPAADAIYLLYKDPCVVLDRKYEGVLPLLTAREA